LRLREEVRSANIDVSPRENINIPTSTSMMENHQVFLENVSIE
jgi:hypothetical protein